MEPPDDLRAWWRDLLGAVPDPDGSWRLGPVREAVGGTHRGTVQQIVLASYGSELTAELFRPTDVPLSGVLVVVPAAASDIRKRLLTLCSAFVSRRRRGG